MNKKLIFSVLLVCLLVGLAVVAFGQTSSNVRWEYRWIRSESKNSPPSIQRLNELGMEGWELVTVTTDFETDWYYAYFKRRLP